MDWRWVGLTGLLAPMLGKNLDRLFKERGVLNWLVQFDCEVYGGMFYLRWSIWLDSPGLRGDVQGPTKWQQ